MKACCAVCGLCGVGLRWWADVSHLCLLWFSALAPACVSQLLRLFVTSRSCAHIIPVGHCSHMRVQWGGTKKHDSRASSTCVYMYCSVLLGKCWQGHSVNLTRAAVHIPANCTSERAAFLLKFLPGPYLLRLCNTNAHK